MTEAGRKPIILINPGSFLSRSWVYRKLMFPVPPMSLAYLAGALEHEGWTTLIVDQFATGVSNRKLAELIRETDPLFVGISCLTPAMGSVRELIVEYMDGLGVRAPIVLGNTHAHVFARQLLEKNLADVVVHGEGERRIVQIAEAISTNGGYRGIPDISWLDGGEFVSTKTGELVDDLEELAYPLWSALNIEDYNDYPFLMIREPVLPIQASRGCPYSCTFCSQDKVYKRPRYRKPEAVIREMEFMHERYGVGVMGFNDSYFPHLKNSGMEFCRLWRESSLPGRMRWFTETRVNMVDQELLLAMKNADCEMIMYGFESGNQTVLDSVSKGTTMEQARSAMKATKKAGLRSVGFFIIGLPGETRETIEQTISFALELDPDMAKFNIFVPMPGSPAFSKYWSEDDLAAEPERFTSWSLFVGSSNRPPFLPEGMSARELAQLQKKAMLSFYLRLSKIWHFLRSGSLSLRHLATGGLVLAWHLLKRFQRREAA